MTTTRTSRPRFSLFERIAQRRTLNYLESLDDHMLADLGVTRGELREWRLNPHRSTLRGFL